jgi:hypothetical protein
MDMRLLPIQGLENVFCLEAARKRGATNAFPLLLVNGHRDNHAPASLIDDAAVFAGAHETGAPGRPKVSCAASEHDEFEDPTFQARQDDRCFFGGLFADMEQRLACASTDLTNANKNETDNPDTDENEDQTTVLISPIPSHGVAPFLVQPPDKREQVHADEGLVTHGDDETQHLPEEWPMPSFSAEPIADGNRDAAKGVTDEVKNPDRQVVQFSMALATDTILSGATGAQFSTDRPHHHLQLASSVMKLLAGPQHVNAGFSQTQGGAGPSLRLNLDPVDLGSVEVSIAKQRDILKVTLTPALAQTHRLLQDDSAALLEAIGLAGLDQQQVQLHIISPDKPADTGLARAPWQQDAPGGQLRQDGDRGQNEHREKNRNAPQAIQTKPVGDVAIRSHVSGAVYI